MRQPVRFGLVMVFVAAGFAAGWTHAQVPGQPQNPAQQPRSQAPVILSGPDIGFRLDVQGLADGRPTGRLVVRIDGRWVEAQWAVGVRPLTGQ